ncbi:MULTISPECIES: DUF4389 domain-containing protein [Methanohalophilus]|jgi:hypothetical protein|uniref:Uncharacterized protein n=1 Tax=Methanohalophilus euhalobius TaxID=51203 RepID=A0A285EP28_9EURY|nr:MULTISPECIES: DUF4389 domain-containing protein [Methanohalophilus]RSD33382.1 MAG: hypothetical protein CI953_1605 [Methanohalophilus sp.]ODV49503.1 MAG: hypothetical protein A8273_1291 [Methanohalophilus sp. 2-GBenrich]PQV42652.1 hypothetical protein B0H22_105116 [Methanohalophilus euhalobius]TCL11253.1 hypothetical protein C7960_0378 [Methanohalophilus euhalobius]SNY00922.1 hypothetical protein SAMN06295989_101343 [Methanohalophilus euhalobius]
MDIRNPNVKQLFSYEKKASILELFYRVIYSILIRIVLYIRDIYRNLSCLSMVCNPYAGRKIERLNRYHKGLEYYTHVIGYLFLTTDVRPSIKPPSITIFEKKLYYDRDTVEILK